MSRGASDRLSEIPHNSTETRAAAAGIEAVFGPAEPSTSHPLDTVLSACTGSEKAQGGEYSNIFHASDNFRSSTKNDQKLPTKRQQLGTSEQWGTRHHRLTRSHRRRGVGVQPTSSNVAGQQCPVRPEDHETIGDTGLLAACVTEMVATRKRSG